MKLFKIGMLSIVVIAGVIGCATSENAGTNSITEIDSFFPVWYQAVETIDDSLSYSGFATAIASDSVKAIERAEIQARIHLENRIAQLTEEVRLDIKNTGSEIVSNTDFIIILRTAHFGIEAAANPVQSISKKTESYYRGFSSVNISKEEIRMVLEKGFAGHPRYWGEFSSSASFLNFF